MRCVLLCDPWPLLSYISHHVYVTKRQHYYPRVKIINHAVLSSGAAAYPHMTDTKHIVYYSHEDVKSRYSLILRIGLYNSWPSHPVDTTRVMYTLHNRRSPQCMLTMNRKIVTSYCLCGVEWFIHYKVLTSSSTMVHLLMASKSSSSSSISSSLHGGSRHDGSNCKETASSHLSWYRTRSL